MYTNPENLVNSSPVHSEITESEFGPLLLHYSHFMALWTLSGTTRVSQYQKVLPSSGFSGAKMKITQADAPTVWMDCHLIQTNWCPHIYHPHHFYAGCPSWQDPPNLSWLGTGTRYAGLHTRWLGLHHQTESEAQHIARWQAG